MPKNARKLSADKIVLLPLSEIRPYDQNPRKNDNAVKYVKESIRQFGFKVPIVIDSNCVVVCGHTRLLAAKSLGMTEVPCIMANDLTDDQVKAFRLADNKVGEFAEWDLDLLGDELDAIADASDIDMGDFGFNNIGMDDEENAEKDVNLTDTYQIIVMCESEIEQQEFFEKLSGEGYRCRLSTL